jgi:hypothetical protein
MSWPDWRRLGVNVQCVHCGRQASWRDGDPVPVCKCQRPPRTAKGWLQSPAGKMMRHTPVATGDWESLPSS